MNQHTERDLAEAMRHCEAEPIHQLSAIQAHGLLLVISTDVPRTILQASENLPQFFAHSAESMLGAPLHHLLDSEALLKLEQVLEIIRGSEAVSAVIRIQSAIGKQDFQLRAFLSDDMYVLEFTLEDDLTQHENLQDLLSLMQLGITSSELDIGIDGYFEQIASILQTLTGYDRVLVYRFDSNWDGEVIAESRQHYAESYMGLHFPASDIPPQARQLYTLNLIRHVADISVSPVLLVPSNNPNTGRPLDMTHASLRSFSPVHIQYLMNMGVKASMSISLLQNGRLWGLIACHHLSAKRLSSALKEACALLGRMVSIKLTAIEAHEQRSLVNKSAYLTGQLLKFISTDSEAVLMERLLPRLLNLFEASGVVLRIEGTYYVLGECPSEPCLDDLISWISNQAETGGFCTEQLSAIYPVADSALPAGILAAPISKDMRSCILWLRIEKPKTVTWAGKAEKLVYSDEQGLLRLSPRHSFASWNETWRGRSSPWLPVEQGIAYPLAAALTESLSQKNQMHQVLTKQKLAEVELRLAASAFESQEGIVVTDPQGIILRVNTAFVHITGYQAEECIGKNPSLLKSWRHDQAFYREMWQKLLRDGAWKGEIWNKRKNGDIYAQHLTITAVKDADGKVKHFVGSYLDICETKAAQAEIERLAFYDPLTGLPNRRYLLDRLKPALASSARTGLHGAVLFIDLDNFKTLNDTLGHDQGDVLLKQVASRLTGCIREGDTLARLGGDEFIIMLENLAENALDSAALTEIVAHKIIATLSQPYGLAGRSFISTPSIGATLFNDQQTVSEELLKEADIAMYEAKKAGRNTVRFFDPNMQKVILARATLEADLRLAISDQQFVLYYQLQIDQQHCAIGAEVLIRWLHPQSGLISPITFIPLAEETGLIVPIGEWVLEMVCRQIRLWQNDPLFSKLEVAVNVSPRQFRQANFVENLQALLITYEINPLRLKLELTENILVEDIEAVVTIMNQLKQLGIQFSLDDFGTGYSSLQYLKRLPLDQLKIDRSFVQDMEFDDNDQAIVRTIIAMALALDLNVIAEGVESLQQKELLKNYGCGNFQGFLFSHPLPVAAFETLVKGQMTIAPVPDWNLKHD